MNYIPNIIINRIKPTVSYDSFVFYERHEYHFPNGYGASVICNPFSYGLELSVLKFSDKQWRLCYTSPITDDVVGHIGGEDELKILLTAIYNLPVDEDGW